MPDGQLCRRQAAADPVTHQNPFRVAAAQTAESGLP